MKRIFKKVCYMISTKGLTLWFLSVHRTIIITVQDHHGLGLSPPPDQEFGEQCDQVLLLLPWETMTCCSGSWRCSVFALSSTVATSHMWLLST